MTLCKWPINTGKLTYLKKISNLLDYLSISNIIELSIDQLNLLLDLDDGNAIKKEYTKIKSSRYKLSEKDLELFIDMVQNTKSKKINVKETTKVFKFISSIYNANPILQDNVNYMDYLETFSKLNLKAIFNMRMYEILDIFKIRSISYENINEENKLVNDLTQLNKVLNTL